ncbi:hypothetical protein HNQ56_003733 [Anaerotaenia torta]|uniref:DUF6711 family protein n=1 Tax=Anaerotaenia torta TaxID=433293 RepID=UPI003D1A04E0
MAFAGYYIKVNGTQFPNSLLATEGYSDTPNIRLDKNAYRDGRGKLNRGILPEKPSTITIKTVDWLSMGQKIILQAFFIPRDVITMEYWNDETNNYETARFYVPEIKYTHKKQIKGATFLNALEIEFIAYEGDQ